MLQRIQSIWLLLAAASGILTFRFAFFSGNMPGEPTNTFQHLTASTTMPILILTIVLISAAFIDIFVFKNRKLQLRIALGCLVTSIILIVLYFRQTRHFVEGNY